MKKEIYIPDNVAGIYRETEKKINGKILGNPTGKKALDRYARLYLDAKPDLEGKDITKLNDWATSSGKMEFLQEVFSRAIEEERNYESGGISEIKTAGHDVENSVHASYQVLRMINGNEGELEQYAIWELATTAVVHNWGRWFGHGDQLHEKTGSFLLNKIAEKTWGKRVSGESDDYDQVMFSKIVNRITNHVNKHGGKNKGDPIEALVQGTDRMQQIAPIGPFREMLYDVGKIGESIYPENGTVSLAADRCWISWIELMSRNLYQFYDQEKNNSNPKAFQEIMKENQIEADRRRALSVSMLMILAEFKPDLPIEDQNSLAKQIFAPELGVETTETLRKKYPGDIFEEGLKKYKDYLVSNDKIRLEQVASGHEEGMLEGFIKVSNSYVDKNVMQNIIEKFKVLDPNEKINVLRALHFCFLEYKEEVEREIELSQKTAEVDNVVVRKLSMYVGSFNQEKLSKIKEFENKYFSPALY